MALVPSRPRFIAGIAGAFSHLKPSPVHRAFTWLQPSAAAAIQWLKPDSRSPVNGAGAKLRCAACVTRHEWRA
jgi:hypothetical protein